MQKRFILSMVYSLLAIITLSTAAMREVDRTKAVRPTYAKNWTPEQDDMYAKLQVLKKRDGLVHYIPKDIWRLVTSELPFSIAKALKANKQLINSDLGTSLSKLGLRNLRGIELIKNKLAQLQVLNLSYNKLTIIAPETFSGFNQLRELYLFYNKLTTMVPGIFDGLAQLQVLNLSYNKLTAIVSGTFNGLVQVRILHLHANDLTTIAPGEFAKLIALRYLTLPISLSKELRIQIKNEVPECKVEYL